MEPSFWQYDDNPSDDACHGKIDRQVLILVSGRTAVSLYDHEENQGCRIAEEWIGSEMARPGHIPHVDVSNLPEGVKNSGQILMQHTPRELHLRS